MKINFTVVDPGAHPTHKMVLEQHISENEDENPSWSKFVCWAADDNVGALICEALGMCFPKGIWFEAKEDGNEETE